MTIEFRCVYSQNKDLQKFINEALRSLTSYSVYEAEFLLREVRYHALNSKTGLKKINFIIVESFDQALILAKEGIIIVCIDEESRLSTIHEYTALKPKNKISCTFIMWLRPEFFLRLITVATQGPDGVNIKMRGTMDIFDMSHGDGKGFIDEYDIGAISAK
jgi:hypothetical protein